MKKILQRYGWVIWLGGTLAELTGFAPHNCWQWWIIVVPVAILVVWSQENEN